MKNTVKLLALLMALLMVLSLAACGGKDDSAESSAKADTSASDTAKEDAPAAESTGDTTTEVTVGSGKVLNGGFYLNETWIGSFDPTGCFLPGVCWGIKAITYDVPLLITADGYTSRVFSEYEWVDETTFVATIKDEVCFNNGDPMTPEDIIFSFDFMKDSWQASWYSFIDLENSYGEGNTLYLKTLHGYAAADMYMNVAILNKDVMEARMEAVNWEYAAIDSYALDFVDGIASGPYKCIESVNESHAVYVLREDWWGMEEYGSTMTSQLNAYYYGDQTTMGIDLQNGKIDLALNVSLTDAKRAYNGESGDIALGTTPQNGIYYVQFSDVCEDLKDLNLRKAIASCINVQEMTDIALDILGTPADCYFASTTEGYVPGTVYEYDLDAAREYLAASDHADGAKLNLLCDTDSTFTTLAEAYQFYCSQIGVEIELNIVDAQSKGTLQTEGGINSSMGYNGDVSAAAWAQINGWDQPRYPDIDYTSYTDLMTCYENAKVSGDFDYRVTQYQEIAQIIYDNVIFLPISEYSHSYLYNSTVIDNDNTFICSFIQPDVTQIAMK